MKKALITGITGQDGSYLAELLLHKKYQVHGVVRRSSTLERSRIDHLNNPEDEISSRLKLHYGELLDPLRMMQLIQEIEPDEIYNLGAQTHVRVSFDEPLFTGQATGLSSMVMLESLRLSGVQARFYQASSSEMFGAAPAPQNEETSFHPRSPYGIAKVYAYWATRNYREAYGMHASNGILFNHESPRRGESFVTRKISIAVARIHAGLQKELELGNLDAVRDWGYAPDYVVAMWKMLQVDEPSDLVIATGTSMTVRDFVQASFQTLDMDWEKHVVFNKRLTRPSEVDELIGDFSKAERKLGWKPSVTGTDLPSLMIEEELKRLAGQKIDKPIGSIWSNEVQTT